MRLARSRGKDRAGQAPGMLEQSRQRDNPDAGSRSRITKWTLNLQPSIATMSCPVLIPTAHRMGLWNEKDSVRTTVLLFFTHLSTRPQTTIEDRPEFLAVGTRDVRGRLKKMSIRAYAHGHATPSLRQSYSILKIEEKARLHDSTGIKERLG